MRQLPLVAIIMRQLPLVAIDSLSAKRYYALCSVNQLKYRLC